MELKPRYLLLAFGLHALLFALLFVSVLFQKKIQPPPSIEAVLIDPVPTPAPPPPKAEPKPVPPKPVEPPKPPPPPKVEPKKEPEPPKPNPAKEMARFKADILLKLDCDNLTQMKMDAAALDDPNRRKIMESLISDRYAACRKKEEDKKKKEEEQQKKAEELAQKRAEDQRKKDEAEIKRQFELEQKAEQKRVDEANRAREAAAEAQRQRDMAAALGAEQAARDAAAKAGRQATWADQISAAIRRNWTRPPGSPTNFQCVVRVELTPVGSVVSAKVIRTCGSGAALDESVEKAVLKSDPLPLPANPADFDRVLKILFDPNPPVRH